MELEVSVRSLRANFVGLKVGTSGIGGQKVRAVASDLYLFVVC